MHRFIVRDFPLLQPLITYKTLGYSHRSLRYESRSMRPAFVEKTEKFEVLSKRHSGLTPSRVHPCPIIREGILDILEARFKQVP